MALKKHSLTKIVAPVLCAFLLGSAANAGPLDDRIADGEPIRLGFASASPWAYMGDDGSAKGFVNTIAIDVLKRMGYTNVEPVLTEWAGLIPSLKANRVDIVTGGMYIIKARCENMNFSAPIGAFGDAFVVAKGNPKNIQTYQDVIDQNLILAIPSGWNTLGDAKKAGVPVKNIIEVPGSTEALAAVRAGRADAFPSTDIEVIHVADKSDDFGMSDPKAFVGRKKQVVGIGFRPDDSDFMAKFNKVLAGYMGSDEMMARVRPDGYIAAFLPKDLTTEEACKHD
ncbi:transporter substrate-binding domain-containing protein [Alcaligenaceae bacterium]|nr:transporter substrate-binding domain-containing protein [Alcaligenaceae bacterium]